MYTTLVKNQDEALSHLFFHYCYRDGDVSQEEIDFIAEKFVELGLQTNLDFRHEVMRYRTYRRDITDDTEYLRSLVLMINPVHARALYAYCLEVALSDANLELSEEQLLTRLAEVLEIGPEEQAVINKVFIERAAVRAQKLF